jgi:hypothetical protein
MLEIKDIKVSGNRSWMNVIKNIVFAKIYKETQPMCQLALALFEMKL